MNLLTYLLTGSVGDQHRAVKALHPSSNVGGTAHWPEPIQHLLRTYATD